ncbi:hypothetical protein P4R38_06900, partial [Luteipulveratus sp. YIM 133296]|nr:hypothetical protein [Luteipulveratus sp. YIM 133296]
GRDTTRSVRKHRGGSNAVLLAIGLAGLNIRRLHHWSTTRGRPDPWEVALGEPPDTRPLDHVYRPTRHKRRDVDRQ